jgi:hypothetical protein
MRQHLTETRIEEFFRIQDDLVDDRWDWFTDDELAGLRVSRPRRVGSSRRRFHHAEPRRDFLLRQ